MEMPTPCLKCGEIFDLNDGWRSEKWFPGNVICEPCGQEEEAEIERDDEISVLKEEIEEAEYALGSARKRLAELVAVPEHVCVFSEVCSRCGKETGRVRA